MVFKNRAAKWGGESTSVQYAVAESMPQVETKFAYGWGISWELCEDSELDNDPYATALCVCTDSLGQSVNYFGRL